jgi:hypothetical protein
MKSHPIGGGWLLCFILSLATSRALAQSDEELMAGVIDIHCHVAPDPTPRPFTDFDLVRMARRAGMRGIVLKSHYLVTADRAQLVMKELGGVEVFGGVALNRAVGGLNAEVIRKMLTIDGHRGKIVWLPTFDSENQVKWEKADRPFIPVVKDGKPVPELAEIFEIVAQNDLALAMGHSGIDESMILIDAAKRAGVKKLVVTHVMSDPVGANIDQMKKLAGMGALLECVYLHTIRTAGGNSRQLITNEMYANAMKTVGPEHFIIASDLGQQLNPVHPDGMLAFIKGLKGEGITDEQIDRMARRNPARLLGLDP